MNKNPTIKDLFEIEILSILNMLLPSNLNDGGIFAENTLIQMPKNKYILINLCILLFICNLDSIFYHYTNYNN